MRDYQRTHDNPYILPEYLYKTVKFAIKDYDRVRSEYDDILYGSSSGATGVPRSAGVGQPT